MIILHIVEPFSAGIATFIRQLTVHLPNDQHIILHGERPEVIDPEKVKQIFPSNVKFIKWINVQREIRPWSDLKAFVKLYKVLKMERFDVVHLHSSKAGFLGRIACKLVGFDRVVYSPNGGSFLRTDISNLRRKLFVRLERFANIFNGVVICACPTELQAFSDAGILAKFIDNGTDITELPAPIPKKKFRVLLCGNVTFQKYPELFNRIALQFEKEDDVEFIWLGDGKDRKKLSSKNIVITGWLSREEVARWLYSADVYVSCSRWEGLPYAVLEAMNNENALLLTRCVGNIELVKEGYNGYFFDMPEAAEHFIRQFMADPALVKKFGENSRAYCNERFDVVKGIAAYEHEYRTLLALIPDA